MAKTIREKEVENKVIQAYFSEFDWTKTVGDIDVTICSLPRIEQPQITFLWAEAKQGTNRDIYESLIQLILTVGKARTFESDLPPFFFGAFDAEKIAFVEYNKVMHIFAKTDFNWNVTPSDHGTKEFKELYGLLHDDLMKDMVIFKYAFEEPTLKKWIKKNFREGKAKASKIPVGKNNFPFVYYEWVNKVKGSILVDWDKLQKVGVLDCDFFLADLMSKDDMSIKDKLKVVLEKTKYKVLVKTNLGEVFGDAFKEFSFNDGQSAYNQFWNRYERPPKPIYQRHILDRKDLLVPQDIREVKGSYYTPEQWVRLAQEYLANVLGEDWQEEYYVWDCAAGSGNLLRGLTNKYNIYASTLDDSDVRVMHDAIDGGRLNLLKNNVFQFDFLNDGYEKGSDGSWISALTTCEKIPESLRQIVKDPVKREKLILLINPPYATSGSGRTSAGTGNNKKGVAKNNKAWEKYRKEIGPAAEIPSSVLAEFSTLKILQAPNFSEFRRKMNMYLSSLFIVPGDTFDNVKGVFPIGFHIWRTNRAFESGDKVADVYHLVRKKEVERLENKHLLDYDSQLFINDWVRVIRPKENKKGKVPPEDIVVGYQVCHNNDFQNQKYINLYSEDQSKSHRMQIVVTPDLLLFSAVYHAVRAIPVATWLNDRDQFLKPNDGVYGDLTFQTDCLVWSIFNNAVRMKNGKCHWIPFNEDKVKSPSPFNSRFMANFLQGKIKRTQIASTGNNGKTGDLFEQLDAEKATETKPADALSNEAKEMLEAGRQIWMYYMSKPGISVNASFLDIRTYFQGHKTTPKGKTIMNSTSEDKHYSELLRTLREKQKALEAAILPKIYEYGFLID